VCTLCAACEHRNMDSDSAKDGLPKSGLGSSPPIVITPSPTHPTTPLWDQGRGKMYRSTSLFRSVFRKILASPARRL
jgi:hypothetical protein